MAIRSLGLAAAALAVASEAFLIPLDMSSTTPVPDLSTWTVVDPSSQPLIVPCQGCKVDGFSTKADANILLNLTVGVQPGTIELNGEVVYPLNPFTATRNPKVLLLAPGVLVSDLKSVDPAPSQQYQQYEDVISGWLFGISTEHISEVGDEIISVSIDIQSIGSQHVRVPHVDFKVLKNPEDHMMILSGRHDELMPGTTLDMSGCTSRLCRLREILENRLSGFASAIPRPAMRRPCHRHKGMSMAAGGPIRAHHSAAIADSPDFTILPYTPINSRPAFGHMRHHRHHHRGPVRAFAVGFWHVLRDFGFPILVGLAAGMLTYTIGMIVLGGLALLCVRLRGGRGSVSLDEYDELSAKQRLDLEADVTPRESFESAPPLYEHAPEYVEKEAEVPRA